MRKFILLSAIFCLSIGCKLTEKPEFVRVDKVKVVQADLKTIALEADAVFLNRNHLGGVLRTDNIDVFVDEHLIAKVASEEFKVPAQDEFTVPMSVNFDTSKLISDKNNSLLGSLLKQFLNKKVTVQFKGELKYEVVGFKSAYAIDHVEEIRIK